VKEVDDNFRHDLGEPEIVLSMAAMGFLLTLTPQVQMGFGTLRSVLFDTYLAARLTTGQRYAYRIIATTGEWDVPWSRRATLNRVLSNTLMEQARVSGKPVKQIRETLLKTDNPEFSAQIIANTLDNMGIIPKSRDEVHALRATVERLEKELKAAGETQKAFVIPRKGKPKRIRRRTT